jgi:hypothetical protein
MHAIFSVKKLFHKRYNKNKEKKIKRERERESIK